MAGSGLLLGLTQKALKTLRKGPTTTGLEFFGEQIVGKTCGQLKKIFLFKKFWRFAEIMSQFTLAVPGWPKLQFHLTSQGGGGGWELPGKKVLDGWNPILLGVGFLRVRNPCLQRRTNSHSWIAKTKFSSQKQGKDRPPTNINPPTHKHTPRTETTPQ